MRKVCSGGGSAYRDAEEYGYDVHQLVLGGLGEAVGNAALAEQVTQHKQADKRRRGRQHEGYEYGDHDGEYYLLLLAYRPQLLHLYPALFLCRQRLHYRRLYDRNQRHVRISRDGDRTEKIGSKPTG